MNFAEMLSFADIGQLTRIASSYQCECSGHSKNELIQSILSTVGRRDILDRQVREMKLEDLRFLNFLLFEQNNTFSLEELVPRVRQANFSVNPGEESVNPREVIARFKQYGWLFNGYSQQTKFLFQVPEDLKRRFSESLTRRFQERLIVVDEPEVYRDEQNLLVEDTYQFLQYVHHHQVPLTSEGVMYKRNLQQLLDLFAVREEMVGRGGWRFGYGRRFKEYPNRFSLIYDYCYFNRLIEEDESMLRLSPEGREKLEAGRREEPADLYRFWLRLYKGAIPNLVSLVHWTDRLAHRWTTASSLFEVIGPFIKPYYYDTPQSIFETRLLQMMMHLGIIRVGEDRSFGKVIRINDAGSRMIHGVQVKHEDMIELKERRR